MNRIARGHLENAYRALQAMDEHLERLRTAGESEEYNAITGFAEALENAAARFRDAARALRA